MGNWDTPPLLDGGSFVAPRGGFFDVNGEWAVEAEGVAPDIEVMNPDLVICHLDKGAKLSMELTVESGKGYVAAAQNRASESGAPCLGHGDSHGSHFGR